MKSWFAKFRISAALDAGRPLSPSLRAAIARADDLRRFEANAIGLDRTLRNSAPKREAPPELHSSIMRAVRSANHSASRPRSAPSLGWLAAPALAVLLLIVGLWWSLDRPAASRVVASTAPAPPWSVAATALEQAGQLARTAPSVALAPLTDELARADRDVFNATQFLLASLP